MKTIVAFADTHNLTIPTRLVGVIEESDYVFFLGDGLSGLGELAFHPGFHGVKGNCDSSSDFPEEEIVDIEGIRILLAHGNRYNVKNDLVKLLDRAKELECSVVFYGHTHFAEIDRVDNVTLVCPGAIAYPLSESASYVYATISGGQFLAKIVNIT